MHNIKRVLRSIAFAYFGLAVWGALVVWARLLWGVSIARLPGFVGELLWGGLLVGFIALFVATIFVQQQAAQDAGAPSASGEQPHRVTVPGVISFLLLLNFGIAFFAFAAVTGGDHGTPHYYDGQYVMAYRGEVIRELDEVTYLQEIGINQNRTAHLLTAVVLFFTWGVFANYLPDVQGRTPLETTAGDL